MVCESYISHKLFQFPNEKLLMVKNMIDATYDQVKISPEEYTEILDLLKHDKKNVSGNKSRREEKKLEHALIFGL